MSYKRRSRQQYLQKRMRKLPKTMYVSAFVFDAPELTLANVEVLKIKRKYALVRYKSREYEIPKDWLVESLRGKVQVSEREKEERP